VEGWFEGNLANHAATTARAIGEGDAESAVMQQVLGLHRSELSRRMAGAGRRNGRPGAFRSLRKK
jgi:hypothetical protein